jgi:hypothetical protein
MIDLRHILTDDGRSNLDVLLALLKTRLVSSGKITIKDSSGHTNLVDSDVFGDSTLENFLILSLSGFNQVPNFTYYTFNDNNFVEIFAEVLIEGAVIHALAACSLIEKGREFMIEDNGIIMNPPSVADIMTTQYSTIMVHYWDKLKLIKSEIDSFDDE